MLLVKLISKKRNYFSIGKDYTNELSTIVHSDTLFSAICNNYRKLYGKEDLEKFLAIIKSTENFKLTSSFHYVDIIEDEKHKNTIYFIPKPLIKFLFDESSEEYLEKNPKILKKIQFISFEVLKKIQENKDLIIDKFHVLDDKYLIDIRDLEKLGLIEFYNIWKKSGNSIQLTAIRDKISLFNIIQEQRVRISRTNNDSEPYIWPKFKFLISNYYINSGKVQKIYILRPGFYFILNDAKIDDEIISKLISSIYLIMDQGLGGQRSLGCGLVDEIEYLEMNSDFEYTSLFKEKDNGYLTNLSLVFPTPEEFKNIKYFNLFDRSGFIYSIESKTQRFMDIKLIEEGSIFEKKVSGQLVQVAPEEFTESKHEVYKNGLGFYINIGHLGGQ